MSKYVEIPDGWEVDPEKLKTLLLRPAHTYSIGNRFKYEDRIYLLCSAGNSDIVFVNIITGKRFNAPIRAYDISHITKAELEMLLESNLERFELIV